MKMSLELPQLDLPKLEMPQLGLAFFRRRLFFRAVFVLLIAATLGLALAVLQDEKERSYQNYQNSFKKTQSEILARLRHPAGQLALLNPQRDAAGSTGGACLLGRWTLTILSRRSRRLKVLAARCSLRAALARVLR
jgi:hypothetical protein